MILLDYDDLEKSISSYQSYPELLAYKKDLWHSNPFIQIIRNNNIIFLTKFLEEFKPSYLGILLADACKSDNNKIVELLIKHGADVSFNNNEPLYWCCNNSTYNTLLVLLKYGADYTDNDFLPLKNAIFELDKKFICQLLDSSTFEQAYKTKIFLKNFKHDNKKLINFLEKQISTKAEAYLLTKDIQTTNKFKRVGI